MGIECARDASDLLSPRPAGDSQRREALRRRSAPHDGRRSGPTAGSASTSARISRWPTRVGREILAAGLENREFIDRATSGFEEYRRRVEPYTLEYAEETTGVPPQLIRELAHAYATRRTRAALLDAGHHRASQCRRQRARAHQSRAAHAATSGDTARA